MTPSSSPNSQAGAASKAAPDSPTATQTALTAPKGVSSSPNRSASAIQYPWLSRMPLTLEQMVFLTLGVVMFATALIALQIVILVTLILIRVF